MKLEKFRKEIEEHDKTHPELKNCIYYGCVHKIKPAWDNQVLCEEHSLMMLHWFYELDGSSYHPEIFDFDSGKPIPKRKGTDENMTAYRKRYCDWIASLSEQEYIDLLKYQIGDASK
jgi:hypothetical protein